MRSCYQLAWLILSLLVAARAHGAEVAPPSPTPPAPGADAFLGCKKYPGDKKFKWSVRGEVGVGELASSLGQISCRPIVVASSLAQRGAKVSIEVPDLVTAADVYRLFYGALDSMGLTVDASGGSIKIVDAGRAKEVATPELGGALASPADDRYVVRLLHPAHASPEELATLLGKLKSKEGEVDLFGASALVLIDRASNVRRMEELARALDVGEAGARIYTLQTHGQSPSDLAASLEKILGAATRRAGAAPDGKGAPAKGAVASIDADVRALVPLDGARLLAVIGS
ncbi:MAG TPA: hypothetical protein VF997_24895, partial [Polyangia bacterium]